MSTKANSNSNQDVRQPTDFSTRSVTRSAPAVTISAKLATTMASTMVRSVGAAALVCASFVPFQLANAASANYTFQTDIQEVNAGHINGQDILTIQIQNRVGPAACHGNILKVQLNEQHDDQIESIALSAMLKSDPVMITIPLSSSQCVDGKPTVLDISLVPHLW